VSSFARWSNCSESSIASGWNPKTSRRISKSSWLGRSEVEPEEAAARQERRHPLAIELDLAAVSILDDMAVRAAPRGLASRVVTG
jgi:hypothetical protein